MFTDQVLHQVHYSFPFFFFKKNLILFVVYRFLIFKVRQDGELFLILDDRP